VDGVEVEVRGGELGGEPVDQLHQRQRRERLAGEERRREQDRRGRGERERGRDGVDGLVDERRRQLFIIDMLHVCRR